MHWAYGTKVFAEVDPQKAISVLGRKASGRHRIRIEICPLMQPRVGDEHLEVLWLAGTLSTMQTEITLLSLAESCCLRTATTAYQSATITLAADLSYRQVKTMNEARADDGSLRLQLTVWGHTQGPAGLDRLHGQDGLTLSNETWQRFLQDSGFAEVLLIEVATPTAPAPSEFGEAVRALADARTKLLSPGRAAEAVGDCRHALDVIRSEPPLPSGVSVGCSDGRRIDDLDLEERMDLLKYALRHATHLPHHDREAEFTRDNARLIVHLTAVLLEHELGHAGQLV